MYKFYSAAMIAIVGMAISLEETASDSTIDQDIAAEDAADATLEETKPPCGHRVTSAD